MIIRSMWSALSLTIGAKARLKTIRLPSGDQAGSPSPRHRPVQPWVIVRALAPPIRIVMILSGTRREPISVNAIRPPRGETSAATASRR